MKFEIKGFKKAASVGVVGSLWLLIASVLGIIESQGSFSDGSLVINIIFLTIISSVLTYLTLIFRKNWFLMLVPASSWVLKEALKQVSGLSYVYNFELFALIILFVIPIGGYLYYLIYIKESVKIWQ